MSSMVLNAEQTSVVEFMLDTQEKKDDAVIPPTQCRKNRSAIVQAMPGSGKTTLLLELARRRFAAGLGATLVITYSQKLKDATREAARSQDGIYVESWHSLVKNHLGTDRPCHTNEHIEDYLRHPAYQPHPEFVRQITLVCIDEMQDMSDLYYRLFQHLRSFFEYAGGISLLGVGDFFQWIFALINDSDIKYMCEAERFFPTDTFARFRLSRSYRLTQQMAQWINKHLSPLHLQYHYTACWTKYGKEITSFWGEGILSAKCISCGALDHSASSATCASVPKQSLKVQCMEQDSFSDKLVPQSLRAQLLQGRSTLLLNGLNRDRYTKEFASVSNAQSYKGCETDSVIVMGFDHLFEQVCAQNVLHEKCEDWPLQCYCQMLVSCTRARKYLCVVKCKQYPAFFTSRSPTFLVPLPEDDVIAEHQKKGTRPLSRLFQFVLSDPWIDRCVQTDLVAQLPESFAPLPPAPNIAAGLVAHTVIAPFGHHYQDAVRLGLFHRLLNPDWYWNEIHDKWTAFMLAHIIDERKKTFLSPKWRADDAWCNQAVARGFELCVLGNRYFAEDQVLWMRDKFHTRVEWCRLTSHVDFMFRWLGVLNLVFLPPERDMTNHQRAWQQNAATFLLWKKTFPAESGTDAYVLNIQDGTLRKVVLLHGMDEEFLLGELIRRKKWDFLLDLRLTYAQLMDRGIAVPVKALDAEREKRRITFAQQREKRMKPT